MRTACLLILASTTLHAAPTRVRHYDLANIRVIDGDTIEATAHLGLATSRRIKIRLDGIDAYELRDKPRGHEAKAFVVRWLDSAPGVELTTDDDERDKYGRYVGRILDDRGRCLNHDLLDAGHAVPYEQ